MQTIDQMYETNRNAAYTSLVSHLPFHLSRNVTPLSLADDAMCMRVIGHLCSQTLLILIWMNHLNVDTHPLKFLPIFTILPFINLPFITVDEDSLSFGAFRHHRKPQDVSHDQSRDQEVVRKRTVSHNTAGSCVHPVKSKV